MKLAIVLEKNNLKALFILSIIKKHQKKVWQ
jgi:hypothetical protein